MKSIDPIDSMFIHMEKPTTPGLIAGFYIVDPITAPNGMVRHRDILKHMEDHLHLVPALRKKLVYHPLGLDEPRLIDDEHFDIEFHVRHIGLPQPRDRRQLNILTARLFSRPMDMDRPLWELYVIEGLENFEDCSKESFALLLKLHHTAFDGTSAAAAIFNLMQKNPTQQPEPPEKRWVPEREPGYLDWTQNTAFRFIKRSTTNAQKFPSIIQGIRQGRAKAKEAKNSDTPPVPFTIFNEHVTSHRVFDYVDFSLDEMLELRSYIGKPKVNDMALCIIAGGLRRYLKKHKSFPKDPMYVGMPINVREEGDTEMGNKVAMALIPFGTDQEDPLERLKLIRATSARGQGISQSMGPNFMADLLKMIPYPVRASGLGLLGPLVAKKVIAPPFNCIATNVPSPLGNFYFAGGKIVSASGLGPVMDGAGLIHLITSTQGLLAISATTCREMMPDVDFYMECLQASYDELKEAALEYKPAAPAKKAKAKKTPVRKAPAKKATTKRTTARRKTRSRSTSR